MKSPANSSPATIKRNEPSPRDKLMVTTQNPLDPRYRATSADGMDGVVRVSYGGFFGTGTLLFDGLAVLTAAHLLAGRSGTASVLFQTSTGETTLQASKTLIHPSYQLNGDGNHDLALVWLDRPAPIDADRHGLYRLDNEVGQTITLAGYGQTGTGNTGSQPSSAAGALRLKAMNRFDVEGSTLKQALGVMLGWTPAAGSQLLADFDDSSVPRDALGQLIGRVDRGTGADEGLIAPGDSGGPAFIGKQIAGVASYISRLGLGSIEPDVDASVNSSFGEVAGWQRVSHYQGWIDQAMRKQYIDAPQRADQVQRAVPEGNTDTQLAFFLLQFNGTRSTPEQILSVDYATRDGTALAGEDYLGTQGTLNLYPGETQAVIAVEIVGDARVEPDEHFFLDVFNPVGGSFGAGVVQLTAMRLIVNDDGLFA